MRHPHLGVTHEMSKWIVKTTALTQGGSIGVHCISGLDSCLTTTDTERFQINHYITQSLPFWRDIKMTREDAHDWVKDSVRDLQTFIKINLKSTVKDTNWLDLLSAFGKDQTQ